MPPRREAGFLAIFFPIRSHKMLSRGHTVKRFSYLLFLVLVSQAQAAVRFDSERWYGIEYHVTILGEIEAGDSDKFKQLVLTHLRASHLISQFNIYSSGGNVDEAFKMGEQIRALAAPTNAPELQPDGKPRCTMGSLDTQTTRSGSCDCQSACFLVWVAGVGRTGSYIGIHRPHFEDFGRTSQKEAFERYNELMSKTKDYFKKLNLPDWVFPRLYSVASGNMLLLPQADILELQNNRVYLEEYIFSKCGNEPGGTVNSSRERKAYIECKMPEVDTALSEGANRYLSLYGNPSEVFIQPPPSQSGAGIREPFMAMAPPVNPILPRPAEPQVKPKECEKVTGDDVIVDVRFGDPDGGLVVRAEPSILGDRLGTIPSDGVGVRREECDASSNWCKVRYECLAGWVSAHFLSSRQSHVFRVVGVSANDRDGGLNVRTGPGVSFSVTGTVPYNATNVVRHNCEVKNGQEWCLISSGTISGWAARRYLGP
jgi:uncharacterized protein YraI